MGTCTLLVMAGGTGGHIFPGLVVAQRMRAKGWRVVWLGNPYGMEAILVPKYRIPIEFVHFGSVRGKNITTKICFPLNLLFACLESRSVLRRVRPDVVLGMGGYITFPAGLISVLTRIPLVLHEQNAVAGLANKLLAKLAHRVLVAFPDVLPGAHCVGNPIRPELALTAPPEIRYTARSGPLRILVVGGSLGAAALNKIVPYALALFDPSRRPYVVHQAGDKHIEALHIYYKEAGLVQGNGIKLVSFIEDMAQAYTETDLVICRAGAMTVSEITAVGVAALFIPFPFAVDNHQAANAEFLVMHRAASVMPENELSAEKLAGWLGSQTRASLAQFAVCAHKLAPFDSAESIAQVCASLIT
ncbi:undecaprenyldiphospho-muramoylpentapeptide beta-N-acetylglucosaminyltransferase [Candidatus Vallotia lariciata]|uniref:undecaprenyldiphospho-muramoylpentapeptide beta-N-acetylglucosaminyltransferase n=1 Tax=Candidatus Vallotia laricis TaxID=2018052 RepID=UPI001D02305B|nr:undecaprenyldiphospho-muramoylpentapeptide beta-N-acetylglucosaminyltransferase [Candidatus Vallotia lariciata]UDG82793.1 UDP-N-acetylglucosamine--N-acetylmuramyl-(pentapeptide) pyrophosphoryl-undecaprenol N-acetylglucosamine transferase [Candidatus Vallotia lariciata]